MTGVNDIRELNFSSRYIGARFIASPRDYYIGARTVVVNPTRSDAIIDASRVNVIPPFSSVILRDVRIREAQWLVLLELGQLTNLGGILSQPGWALYGTLIPDAPPQGDSAGPLPFPKETPLWRSSQDEIGHIALDPSQLPGQQASAIGPVDFLVKVNLWFATANTNCFIHNQHDFIEIHSQIIGSGRMQKFNAQDYSTLYHDEMMSPGYTTAVPFCEVKGPRTFVYPWHQYYADTDCIWMAVEYHPVA